MKRIRVIFVFCFLLSALIPTKGFGNEEKARENLANLLNYAQVSIHVITAFNNRIVLDSEYRSIINNLSLREIPDERVIGLLKRFMDALTDAKLTDREREQVNRQHALAMKKASRNFYKNVAGTLIEGGAGAAMGALSGNFKGASVAIVSIGTSYWDYQARVEDMQAEKGADLWVIEKEIIKELNEINKMMLELSWKLYDEYKIPEGWRLVQKDISELIKLTRARDVGKRFRLLSHSYMKKRFSRYAPYWYYLGSTASQYFLKNGDTQYRDAALQAYGRYEVTRSPVLKKDEMYASVALGRAQLLDPEEQREEVIENLRIIEADPPGNWMTVSGMALLYARVGEYEKAREWAQHNIDQETGDLLFHQQVMGRIIGQQGDLKSLDQLITTMVTRSNAKIFEIMDMIGPLPSEQVAGRLRSSILAVRPSVEELRMLDDHLLLEVPLSLQVDTKEISLFSGTPSYDLDSGVLTLVEDGALYPDEVVPSDHGKYLTYRFKGSFRNFYKNVSGTLIAGGAGAAMGALSKNFKGANHQAKWGEEGRSHVLFRFNQEAREIDLLYAVRGGNEKPLVFELELVGINGEQFVDRDGSFIAAGSFLREAFDASFDGLVHELSVRYGLNGGESELGVADVVRHADAKGDKQAIRDLVRRIKNDPKKSYLDVIELAQVQEDPRETLDALPFGELNLSRTKSILGAAFSLGSKTLKQFGAGEYGEGRENIILMLPAKWIVGKKELTTRLSIREDIIEGNVPEDNDKSDTFKVVFKSAFQIEQWRELEVENIELHIGGTELPLILYFSAQQILKNENEFPPANRVSLGDVSITISP